MKKILLILGCLIVVGSAGATDLNQITLLQAVKQCIVGFPMIVIGIM